MGSGDLDGARPSESLVRRESRWVLSGISPHSGPRVHVNRGRVVAVAAEESAGGRLDRKGGRGDMNVICIFSACQLGLAATAALAVGLVTAGPADDTPCASPSASVDLGAGQR